MLARPMPHRFGDCRGFPHFHAFIPERKSSGRYSHRVSIGTGPGPILPLSARGSGPQICLARFARHFIHPARNPGTDPAPAQCSAPCAECCDARAKLEALGYRVPCWQARNRSRGAACGDGLQRACRPDRRGRWIRAWKLFGAIGAPHSDTNTWSPGGCSRCSRRNARSSSPWRGWTEDVPRLDRRT